MMNAHEYITKKNLVKNKNAITHKPKCLRFYTPDSNFLSGRCYTPKLKQEAHTSLRTSTKQLFLHAQARYA